MFLYEALSKANSKVRLWDTISSLFDTVSKPLWIHVTSGRSATRPSL